MEYIKPIIAALVIGPLLDLAWFGLIASDLYKKQLGPILRMQGDSIKPDLLPAIAVYALIALMVTFFVLPKAGSAASAFFWGALAGLILYGVYDFTNLSFLKDWTVAATVADVAWGTFMVGAVSAIIRFIFV